MRWSATPYAWLSPLPFLFVGALVALLRHSGAGGTAWLAEGARDGLLLFLSNAAHSVGHVIAGGLVGAPNGAVVVTATFHVNSHRCEKGRCSRWTHIGRSLGGPVANLVVGMAALAAYRAAGGAGLLFLAQANLIIAGFLALPIRTVDGWVIWGELLGFRRRTA